MIEQVVHPYNLQRALRQVIVNKGSAGIDKMKVGELTDYFREHKQTIIKTIQRGIIKFKPSLAWRFLKPMVKRGLLGVPTVVERLLQQAVSQVLMPKWENEFSANSYGFRANKTHVKP